MFKKGILCILMAALIVFSAFSDGVTVTGTAPTFKTSDSSLQPFIHAFNSELESVFSGMLREIEDKIVDKVPAGLLYSDGIPGGFGTASVFSSHGATMRAYGEYKFLSISIGGMIGFQLPSNFQKIINGQVSEEDLLNDKNVVIGFNPQVFSLHVGLNASSLIKIFPKDLYFGLRIGFFGLNDMEIDLGGGTSANLNFNTFTIGLTANYQLIKSSGSGLIVWRGLNIGSGFIFQTTTLDMPIPLGELRSPIQNIGLGSLNNLELVLDPRVVLNMSINTFTIPVEAMTAVKLVFLNIPLGIGFDIGFGTSEMSVGLESGVNIEGANSQALSQDRKGSLSVGINNKSAPDAFNLKLMTGLGFAIGETVAIDIPITYYFVNNGFNIGFTVGVRF